MRNVIRACLPIALLILVPLVVMAEDKSKDAPSLTCPVTGKPIDKSVLIDYHGGKLYFSSADSLKKFQAGAEKYAAKANLQLVLTGQAKQTACPLMGKPIVPDKSVMVAGVKVECCCSICQKKISKANPKEQLEMVFGKGFDKGYTVKKS